MAIISKPNIRKNCGKLRPRIIVFSAIIVFIILLVLNTYPATRASELLDNAAHNELSKRADAMAAALNVTVPLTRSVVEKALAPFRYDPSQRIVVCDTSARTLFDSTYGDNSMARFILLPEIIKALSGESMFSTSHSMDSFSCKLSVPVETALGEHAAIYLWKENDAQAVALLNLRVSMLNVSLAICLLFFVVVLIFSGRLTRRLRRLIGGIHKVQNGAYGAQLDIDGHDELTDIAHEFNALSVRIQETEDLRRTFVSDASHELRTPLSAIRLLTDSIIHTDDIDLATTKEFLVDIGDEIDRLTRIAERLLVLTRLDGAKDLILSPVDFNKVTTSAIATLLPYAADAHVTIEQNLSDDCTFLGDRDGAYQIVFNLVENAIKYNREDGFVRVFLFVRDGKCNLIVDDTGIGLDEAHYAHIFERFYRVDKARERTDRGGTGLGLSIVAKNVENAGGEIAVMPSVYGGTRFVVTFNQYVGGASQ